MGTLKGKGRVRAVLEALSEAELRTLAATVLPATVDAGREPGDLRRALESEAAGDPFLRQQLLLFARRTAPEPAGGASKVPADADAPARPADGAPEGGGRTKGRRKARKTRVGRKTASGDGSAGGEGDARALLQRERTEAGRTAEALGKARRRIADLEAEVARLAGALRVAGDEARGAAVEVAALRKRLQAGAHLAEALAEARHALEQERKARGAAERRLARAARGEARRPSTAPPDGGRRADLALEVGRLESRLETLRREVPPGRWTAGRFFAGSEGGGSLVLASGTTVLLAREQVEAWDLVDLDPVLVDEAGATAREVRPLALGDREHVITDLRGDETGRYVLVDANVLRVASGGGDAPVGSVVEVAFRREAARRGLGRVLRCLPVGEALGLLGMPRRRRGRRRAGGGGRPTTARNGPLVAIVGGAAPPDERAFAAAFEGVRHRWVNGFADLRRHRDALAGADLLVVLTRRVGHDMATLVKAVAQRLGVPVLYLRCTGASAVGEAVRTRLGASDESEGTAGEDEP